MTFSLPRRMVTSWVWIRSHGLAVAIPILLLLLISQAVRMLWISTLDRDWDSIQGERANASLAKAVQEFHDLQHEARELAQTAGQGPDVLDYLRGLRNDRRGMFEAVARIAAANDCGIEVFDASRELAAWGGASGPSIEREVQVALDGQWTSNVVRTPVASQLCVASPVRDNGKIIGAIVIRRTVDIDYPLSNRYMISVGLADQLSARLGTTVEFDFSEQKTGRKDGRWVTAPLYGIDDRQVGAVSVLKPARSAAFERTETGFGILDGVLLVVLCASVLLTGARRLLPRRTRVLPAAGLLLLLWGFRYFLIWIEFPAFISAHGIFDPSLFASGFGCGLAQSIGDLLLTVATLALSLWVLDPLLRIRFDPSGRSGTVRAIFARGVAGIVVTVFLFLLLRGFGATIRSALYDSTLSYADPGIIVPSIPLGVMILALGLLSMCMAVVGVRITGHLISWWHSRRMGLIVTSILFLLAAVLFGALQDEPLMSTPYRLIFGASCIGLAAWCHRDARGTPRRTVSRGLVFSGLSLLLLVPLIQRNSAEHLRNRMESFATDFLRPVDGWLKVVVEDGLHQLKEAILVRGEVVPEGRDQLTAIPLAAWARSTACREGYSAMFAVLDSAGNEVGRFAIGSQTSLVNQFAESLPLDSTGMVRIKNIGDGISAVRVYGATTIIREASGDIVGFGRVVIAAGEQQLFRGDNPAVLRGSVGEPIELFDRPITLSEYRDGLLIRTTNMAIPYTQILPDDIRTTLNSPATPTAWSTDIIGNATYDSYAVRRGADSHDVIVLSVKRQSFLLMQVGLVKVPLVYLVVFLLVGGVYGVSTWRRGGMYPLTFRDRLLGAMLLTALVPLVALLVYSQYSVHRRVMEKLSGRLEEETASIAEQIAGIGEYSDVTADFVLRPDRAELIASDVGTDFNMYVGSDLRISSRPELYTAGLLDSRLSGEAYAAVVLSGERFHLESAHVGLYQYEVGYRPVLDAGGGVLGVVAVPSLYRQEEVDSELSEQNAVLIGVYAVVLLALILATTVIANRIAAPVQMLTALTRDVARGDLNILSRLPHAEGEIGELVKSFGAMTGELRRSRDELVQVERELAWREMARQIAHEIKNPLTPMKLSIQHLRQTYRDSAPDFASILDTVTRTIIEQIDTLSRIASEFSSFARMPRRRIEPCDVVAIVQEAVQLFRQDKQVTFRVDADKDLPPVQADRDELRRAFINILRNGVQATTGPGRIDVTLRRSQNDIVIAFRDYGCGIADDVKPRLFQPNFSTKTDGMGLGLAIVKKTMDDLGATIDIVSAQAKGTTVVLTVPAGKEPEAT
jgi:two-component system, NtrC family, nitrogen regulation sensor histidine kinase NtrY